ncbi:hypothetical protein J6590_071700 [Homalodisca vitripennis]|nr:hypothetical protein J6590_071700 [Homalodisca vitripennis]
MTHTLPTAVDVTSFYTMGVCNKSDTTAYQSSSPILVVRVVTIGESETTGSRERDSPVSRHQHE